MLRRPATELLKAAIVLIIGHQRLASVPIGPIGLLETSYEIVCREFGKPGHLGSV
jgi:hypothetical protein